MKTSKFIATTLIIATVCLPVTVLADSAIKTIKAEYGVTTIVNGKTQQMKVDGKSVESLIIGGVVYAPVKALEKAINKKVTWDKSKKILSISEPSRKTYKLPAGTYVFGEDIPVGKYDMKALSGSGNFEFTKKGSKYADVIMMFGVNDTNDYYTENYNGLRASKGDVLEINHDAIIQLTKK